MEILFYALLVLWFLACMYMMVTNPSEFLKLWNARYDPELEREKARARREQRNNTLGIVNQLLGWWLRN